MMTQNEYELQLIDDIARYNHDPYGFVMYAYPWGQDALTGYGSDKPRQWQKDILIDIRDHLSNPETRFDPLLIAVSSGHGIGKSALIGMINHWGLSTLEDTRITITANTETQLRTKTWPEVTKWSKMAINSHWFIPTATSVISSDKQHEKSWRADMIPWSINRPESFAGLHNVKKRIILIFDEGSAIDNIIWEVSEGALTDEDTEIVWIAFGNPTRNVGRFKECFGKFRHRWITRQIDSRDVEGTNKKLFNQWVEDYGEDSDFVRIRVRGIFPRAGSNQFIGRDLLDECFRYAAIEYDWHAKVFGIDIARFGDDQNVVCIRQGRKVYPLEKWRGLDTMQTASKIVELYKRESPDMLFVDGGGVGGGVIDRLKQLLPPHKVQEVNFGSTPKDPSKYYNKRAEMWGDAKDAITEKVDFPHDEELATDLTSIEYGFSNKQQIQLEKKEDMKKRGLASPDCGDALALTFAEIVIREKHKHKRNLVLKTSWRG